MFISFASLKELNKTRNMDLRGVKNSFIGFATGIKGYLEKSMMGKSTELISCNMGRGQYYCE